MSGHRAPGSARASQDVLRRAGELLGGGRRLEVVETFRDSPNVLRCAVAGAAGGPTTVILKLTGAAGEPPTGWREEWVALEWLAKLGDPSFAPRCYGADPTAGVLVIEDVGGSESLLDVLMEGDGERAGHLLVALARRLGALHAATAGRGAELAELRRRRGLADRSTATHQAQDLRRLVDGLEPALRSVEAAVTAGFLDEASAVAAALERPGPFLTFTHGDPCPDNCRVEASDVRLIDFEDGGLRHAWTDGVFGRMLFPTCWCVRTIPEPVLAEMESVYAGAWTGMPRGDLERARLDACAYWLLATLGDHLPGTLEQDEVWGIATLRQRILSRLGAFLAVAGSGYGEIRRVAEALAEILPARWHGTADLAPFPAFAGTTDAGDDLAAYAGAYTGELGTVRIGLQHGQLFLHSPLLGENLPCLPREPETFAFKYGVLRFLRSAAGTLTGFEVDALGTTLEMKASAPPQGDGT